MKILKILSGDDGGGVYTCEKQYIKYWESVGIQVDAIIAGEGKSSNVYKKLVNNAFIFPELTVIKNVNLKNKLLNLRERNKYVHKNSSLLTELQNYDAIIYRKPRFQALAGCLGKNIGCPVYWHMAISMKSIYQKYYYHYIIKKYNIIPVANSEYTKTTIGSVCNHVIYPGYDDSRINLNTDNDLRKDYNIPKQGVVFGVAARIDESKAQHLVIRSFIKLLKEYSDIHLIIAGELLDTEYEKKCLALAKPYNENIHFVGYIENIQKFFSAINIYVNSRINAEPFGISIAEALGHGLPVIAYKLGGPSEMVIENVNGWLIEKPTHMSYYDTLKKAMNKKEHWIKMGQRAKKHSNKYRADKNAHKFLDLIESKK